ncbi:MAG: DNA repair protein RecO [Chitinophagaceae bacterium]|nr:DNA repair protein RecO [Chitinophagaceae bacterium]
MLHNTKGIVLRTIKYGDTSLIVSIFTHIAGIQSYMLKGIRSEKNKTKRAGLLHTGAILDIVAEHKPNRQLQHLREFQPCYYFQSTHHEVVKNAIVTYCIELLQKLLPKEEEMEDLFSFTEDFLRAIDQQPINTIANYPLFFTIKCGKYLGYNVMGAYSEASPYLDASEGIFSMHIPQQSNMLSDNEVQDLSLLMNTNELDETGKIHISSISRGHMLAWYIQFLQHHTQHFAAIKSLEILKIILH